MIVLLLKEKLAVLLPCMERLRSMVNQTIDSTKKERI